MAVNVSSRQFIQKDFEKYVSTILEEKNVEAFYLKQNNIVKFKA